MALEKELAYFTSILDELLKHHEGKFALVVGQSLEGTFDTRDAAYNAGIDQFGNIPMLIKKIERDEPTESIPAMSFGLISVDT